MYKTSSGVERGTLYQLRNAINRRNISSSCKVDLNSCEDFFELVVSGHVLAAVMHFMSMSSMDDTPSSVLISPDVWLQSDAERTSTLMDVATQVVNKHVDLSIQFSRQRSQPVDTVYSYACETLSLGLLYAEFRDVIKEGDGDRVLRVWKFLCWFSSHQKGKIMPLKYSSRSVPSHSSTLCC